MTGSPRISTRTLSLLTAFLVGLILLGASAVMAAPLSVRSTTVDDRTAELELLRIRAELARVHRDQLTHRVVAPLADLDLAKPGEPEIERVIDDSLDQLELLGGHSTPTGFAALALHGALVEWAEYPYIAEDELWDLMFFTDMARYEGIAPSPTESFEQMLFYDADVAEILHEMAALQITATGTDDPVLADLVETISPASFAPDFIAAGELSSVGGPALDPNIEFYGWERRPDPSDAALHTELVEMIETSSVIDYYTHLELVLAGDPVHSPAEFGAYAGELTSLIGELRLRVDAVLDARAADIAAERVSVDDRAVLLSIVQWIGVLLLVAASAIGLATVVQRSRSVTKQMTIDPLTGVGNRRTLVETQRHLEDADHGFHVLAVIDLDCFKLVNDTHGHAVGDELLVRLAEGLDAIADVMTCDAHTVVRQGGDEFLLSLHASLSISVPELRHRLDTLRTTLVPTIDGDELPLAFSYGLVSATGAPEMASIVRSADLAAYEDKAARRQEHAPIDLVDRVDVRDDLESPTSHSSFPG